MQLLTLDIKNILVSILIFLGGCQQGFMLQSDSPMVAESPHLIMPKDESEHSYDSVLTKLTLVLLTNNEVYAFEGNDIEGGTTIPFSKIKEKILAAKKKFQDKKFVVVIKPTKATSYKNTFDALDEMTINKINRFALEDLSEREKIKFNQ